MSRNLKPVGVAAFLCLLGLLAPLAHATAQRLDGAGLGGGFAALTRVIEKLERSTDMQVYQIQLAANDATGASAVRPDTVRAALAATPGNIAVLYPDMGEPYRSIFAKIIEGIEAQAGAPVASYAVGANAAPSELVASLKRQDIRVVITLGREGLKAASALEREFGVVVGGVVSGPEGEARNFAVVSLAPDPGMLFERLKQFVPGARRVVVVYNPKQNAWLMRLARDAARRHGLELLAVEASDLKSAVRLYQEQLASIDPRIGHSTALAEVSRPGIAFEPRENPEFLARVAGSPAKCTVARAYSAAAGASGAGLPCSDSKSSLRPFTN